MKCLVAVCGAKCRKEAPYWRQMAALSPSPALPGAGFVCRQRVHRKIASLPAPSEPRLPSHRLGNTSFHHEVRRVAHCVPTASQAARRPSRVKQPLFSLPSLSRGFWSGRVPLPRRPGSLCRLQLGVLCHVTPCTALRGTVRTLRSGRILLADSLCPGLASPGFVGVRCCGAERLTGRRLGPLSGRVWDG